MSRLGTTDGRRFVVVSGLPGSGKSRVALQLAPLLGLAVVDKDDVLERLFNSKGIGDSGRRQKLSAAKRPNLPARIGSFNGRTSCLTLEHANHEPGFGNSYALAGRAFEFDNQLAL